MNPFIGGLIVLGFLLLRRNRRGYENPNFHTLVIGFLAGVGTSYTVHLFFTYLQELFQRLVH